MTEAKSPAGITLTKRQKQLLIGISLGTLLFILLICGTAIFLINGFPVTPAQQPGTSVTPSASATPSITPTVTQTPTAAELVLRFKNYTLTVSGLDSEHLSYDFWNQQPQTREVADVEDLYEFFGSETFFYVPSKDTFYELQPGGHISYSIVDDTYITRNTGTSSSTTQQNGQPAVRNTITCSRGLRKVGDQYYTALECREQTFSGNELNGEGYKVSCLLNFTGNKYLLVNQESRPVYTDSDMCDYLQDLGVTSITLNN